MQRTGPDFLTPRRSLPYLTPQIEDQRANVILLSSEKCCAPQHPVAEVRQHDFAIFKHRLVMNAVNVPQATAKVQQQKKNPYRCETDQGKSANLHSHNGPVQPSARRTLGTSLCARADTHEAFCIGCSRHPLVFRGYFSKFTIRPDRYRDHAQVRAW